ncbi:MAG: hypothetical protein KDB90_06815 [Planctomycetes bacterium]|nr:hypothetical protein [Planctomycetota bacterium]
MKTLMTVGAILLALGLAGMIWGGVEMYNDRDTFDVGDVHVIVDEGDFPPIGIAGAIASGVGVLMIGTGAVAGRKD